MNNFDDYANEKKRNQNPDWPYIPGHPYRILIMGGLVSGKENALLNLINNQLDIDKIYFCVKDPYEAKYQLLINTRKRKELKHFDDPKAFIKYSNDMHDVYKNFNECNIDKDCEILIVFYDMIADMISNKKLNAIVTELFIRGRKLNISLAFIMRSYFKIPKDARINSKFKIPNKRELQKIAINHSSDTHSEDFSNISNKCTNEPYSFLVNETTLHQIIL